MKCRNHDEATAVICVTAVLTAPLVDGDLDVPRIRVTAYCRRCAEDYVPELLDMLHEVQLTATKEGEQ